MAASKRKAKKNVDEPSAKRVPKPRAARLQDDPIWSTSNAKSHLAHEELHALYSSPATYESWTKEDWEEVRDCFPDNVQLNEDGYSVAIKYLKYDPDWRRLVREFQEDLGAGRYDPTWQTEAAQAMEERARGDFDDFKEQEYEEFWGQKQKSDRQFLAGESSKVKLEELLKANILRAGDQLSYRRHFNRPWGDWMVEKELKILQVDGSLMRVGIPPEQLKFARLKERIATNGDLGVNETVASACEATTNVDVEKSLAAEFAEDVVVVSVLTLNNLEDKVLDIDGRMPSKDAPASSAWRAMRAKRNNQDLGSLFEMRDEYFVYLQSKDTKARASR